MKIRVPFFILLLMVGMMVVQRLDADGVNATFVEPWERGGPQFPVEAQGDTDDFNAPLYSSSFSQATRTADGVGRPTLPIVLAGAR